MIRALGRIANLDRDGDPETGETAQDIARRAISGEGGPQLTTVTLSFYNGNEATFWRGEVHCVVALGVYLWDCPAVNLSVTPDLYTYQVRPWGTEMGAFALEVRAL